MNVFSLLRDPALGSVIGVAGIFAAIYFYLRSKRQKELVFVNKENVVIDDAKNIFSDRLKISFDGLDVARVTRTVFVFWNAGKEIIRKSDIAEGDPIRIEFPEGTRILATSIDRETGSAIRMSLLPHESLPTLFLSFDFLDFRNGANFSIVHSGSTAAWSVKGTVLGMPSGIKDWGLSATDVEKFRTPQPDSPWYIRLPKTIFSNWFKWIMLCIPPIIIFGSIFTGVAVKFVPSLGQPETLAVLVPGRINIFWLTLGAVLLFFEAFAVYWMLQIPPKTLTS